MSNIEIMFSRETRKQSKGSDYTSRREKILEFMKERIELVKPLRNHEK